MSKNKYSQLKKSIEVDILEFLLRIRDAETVERYKFSLKKSARNTVAAHSWRLALMVILISRVYKIKINVEHAVLLALLHDIAEIITGDIDAYAEVLYGKNLINKKIKQEKDAVRQLTQGLSVGKDMIMDIWSEYTGLETREAKFVHALDKIEGFLHIAEARKGSYIQKKFHAFYADEAVKEFPELLPLLDTIKIVLKEKLGNQVAWVDIP